MSAVNNNLPPNCPVPGFCFVLTQSPNHIYPQDPLSLTSKVNVHRFIVPLCTSIATFVSLLILIKMGQGPLLGALVFSPTLANFRFNPASTLLLTKRELC